MEPTQRSTCENRRVRWHEQRLEKTRFPFCGFDDLLCVHAGYRHGERSRDDLFSLQTIVSRLRLECDLSLIDALARTSGTKLIRAGLGVRLNGFWLCRRRGISLRGDGQQFHFKN